MTEPCRHEGRLATLEHQDTVQADTLMRIESKMDIIMTQIAKISILENNHTHQDQAVGRAFAELGKMTDKVTAHDRAVYIATGFIMAMSVFWTVMGYRINVQIDDVVKGVTEMRAHIAADRMTSMEDARKAVEK